MSTSKLVKDLMIDVFEYPHIPYWFSIRQAIGIIKKSLLSKEKCLHPAAILVFDEKYNLVGTAGIGDILRGLEPKFLKPATKAQVHEENAAGLSILWAGLFNKESKEAAERPVSEVMVPAKVFAQPGDPVTKAAYMMIHNDLILLPVLEDQKKLVGLVRMAEVFNELSDAVIEK